MWYNKSDKKSDFSNFQKWKKNEKKSKKVCFKSVEILQSSYKNSYNNDIQPL